MNHGEWLEKHLFRRVRWLFNRWRDSSHGNQTSTRHDSIVGMMDYITCVFVPVILTAAMFTLASIKPLMIRIAIVGVFGLLFSLSVKTISGHPTRVEVFAVTAGFFAVASVFVGTTSGNGASP